MIKKELLSPAGNKEMLYMAINCGADAVYIAGKNFGARKFASNFTNEELIDAIKYAHLYGVKVYITVNTLIFENEIKEFLDYIIFLYKNGADAFIIQDLGMISLVKETYPEIVIHASTQVHNHTLEEVKFLKKLGVSRVVLAREMILTDINKIDVDIEKEIFIHGALCVSYSGQCLFSSLNGGRSGNRGECVGSCRLPYKLYKNNELIEADPYLLSMKELNTSSRLKEILDSNIASLKIEGRMRSIYYVGYVTKLYRILIDKYYNNEPLLLTKEEEMNLMKIYNREFTTGYLFNEKDVANIKTSNHQGFEIGHVVKIDDNYIYIKLENDSLNQEDAIRFSTSNCGMIVNKLYDKKELLTSSVNKNNICMVDKKFDVILNEKVLKTIDKKLNSEIKNYPLRKVAIDFIVKARINKPLEVTIIDDNHNITMSIDKITKAVKHEVSKEEIERLLKKVNNTPFKVNKINIAKDDNIFISLKSINEIKRLLIEELIIKRQEVIRNVIKQIPDKKKLIRNGTGLNINVLVRNEEQLKSCLDNNVNNIYVPDYKLYQKYKHLNNIYYRVDRVLNKYPIFNKSNLLVGELGAVNNYKNNNLVGDYSLNVTNSKTIEKLNNNVKLVTLSVELNKDKIEDIMKKPYNVEIIIYGRVEAMIMKYCPLKKVLHLCPTCNNDKYELEDKYKNRYPLVHSNCITHVMNANILNKIEDVLFYKNLGINNFRLELFDEDYKTVDQLIKIISNK